MAIYTNLDAVQQDVHGIWRSSNLRSTIAGHLFDARVQESQTVGAETKMVDIDVDNGVAIAIGEYTGEGLQERLATIAGVKDKICVTANVPIVKDAFTKAQESEVNFYTKAGQLVRAYQVEEDDIFGVGLHQFSNATASDVAVGAYVKVDGNGGWTAVAAKPTASATGFIGKIHSIQTGLYFSVVNILTLQNADMN